MIVSREFPNDQVASAPASFFNEVQLLFSPPGPLPSSSFFSIQLAIATKRQMPRIPICGGATGVLREPRTQKIRRSGKVRDTGIWNSVDSVAFSALWHVHDSCLRFVFQPFAVKGIQISRFGESQVENALIGH